VVGEVTSDNFYVRRLAVSFDESCGKIAQAVDIDCLRWSDELGKMD
jgi:hypothetical protein